MTSNTKQRIIKILMYIIVGFGCAFFWHKLKS
jgi:multisubunit Na+/H+ antiporter MnhB subunit